MVFFHVNSILEFNFKHFTDRSEILKKAKTRERSEGCLRLLLLCTTAGFISRRHERNACFVFDFLHCICTEAFL